MSKDDSTLLISLDSFKEPNFIKKIPSNKLNETAKLFRDEIIKSVALNGGHLSSNLGIVELTMALHRHFNLPTDKLIFDVGHQCYTHKLLSGRSLDNLRQKDGISGFQKMNESAFDPYEGGHASTSISSAYGMAVARDLKGENYNIICVIGDSSLASGLAFEALNQIGTSDHKVIIVVNDNEMAISRPVGSLSRYLASKKTVNKNNNQSSDNNSDWYQKYDENHPLKPFSHSNIFEDLGFTCFGPVSGYDFKKMEKIFTLAEKCPKSCVIHVKTKKGLGYEPAEHDSEGHYHGVEPFDIKTGQPLKVDNTPTWSSVMADILDKNMAQNDKLVVITPAMTVGSHLEGVFNAYKERCFDVGIAEGHAVVMATGMALNGLHPVIVGYSTFMQRGLDQFNHDLCRLNGNATILMDRVGLIGQDGATHQGIYDEAYLMATPNTILAMPSNQNEAEALFDLSLDNNGPFIIRYPRAHISPDSSNKLSKIKVGKWIEVIKGSNNDKCLITLGPVINDLTSMIIKDNLDITLINAIFLKPLDETMLKSLMKYKQIYLYNPYGTKYGLINEILDYLITNGYQGKVSYKCVPNKYIEQASQEEQLKDNGLDLKSVMKWLKK